MEAWRQGERAGEGRWIRGWLAGVVLAFLAMQAAAVQCTQYSTRSWWAIWAEEPYLDSKVEACRRAMRGVTSVHEAGPDAWKNLPLVLIDDSGHHCFFREKDAVFQNEFYQWGYDTRAGNCTPSPPPAAPVLQNQGQEEGGESCRRGPLAFRSSASPGEYTSRPIALASGVKVFHHADLEDLGPQPLALTRNYLSRWNHSPLASLGNGWAHSHAHRLVFWGTANSGRTVLFGDGRVSNFAKVTGTGQWSAVGSQDTLQEAFDGFTYKRAADDSVWTFHPITGRVLSVRDRTGWTTTYSYTSGLLKQVTNHFGRKLTFTHDAQNRIATATLAGSTVSYAYDGAGRLASVTYPDGTSKSYVYEDARWPDAITGVIDESGQRWATVAYDDQGRAIQSELAGAVERSTVQYASNSTTVTDALGFSRTYQYQALTGAAIGLGTTGASAPSADGNDVASQVFEANSLLASQADFLGVTTMYTWDITRRLPTAVTEAAGRAEARTTQYTWHASLRLPLTETNGDQVTTYGYDTAGRLLTRQVTDTPAGTSRTWSRTYTPAGLVATETEPSGAVTTFGYDTAGQLVQFTGPLGHVTTYARDAAGRVLTENDPTGLLTSYTYDLRGRLLTMVRGGQQTTFTYTPTGQLYTAAFPSGHVVTYRYDTAQRLTGWQDNRGSDATFVLDALGNRTSEQIRATGGAVVWQLARTINGANRVVAETVGANQTTTFGHDANGQVTSEANALSQTTSYGLDGLKRLSAITDAANAVATLAYDARDAVTTATDFKGVATTYARNAFGEAAQETSPDIGSRATQFDAAGRPSQVTDALGQTTTITRDVLGRPTQLAFADGKTTVLRHDLAGADYNAPGAPNASKGRLSEVQDRSGTTRWQRDLQGRVTQKVQVLANGSTQVVGYTYNAKGLLDTLTYPGGGQLRHHYTAAGQLTAMDWNGAPLVTGITWNAAGQPTGWTWAFATPVQASRSYDTAGRMTANEFASYTWDAAGRLTGISQMLARPGDADPVSSSIAWGAITFTASYDAVGRITGFGNGTASTSFSYDANGNRLSSGWSEAGSTETRSYAVEANSNRLASVTQAASGPGGSASATIGYIHDANGALTFDGRNRYAYDAEGRLSSSAPATGEQAPVTRYAHNTLGQRVFKTEPQYAQAQQAGEQSLWEQFLAFFGLLWSPQTQPNEQLGWAFVYDEAGTLLSEMGMGGPSSTGSTHHIWVPTPSGPMPIAAIVNGGKFAVHADHLNTPRRLTDEGGHTGWQWAYSAFGDEEPTRAAHRFSHPSEGSTTSFSDVTYNLRYPGQYDDRESGLNYNYFRTYSARDGRYTQTDPIGMRGGWNRFPYASADPLRIVDSQGLLAETLWDAGNLIYDLWNGNWEDAAWDAAAMCIPGVPAGLTKIKGVSKAFSKDKQALVDMARKDKKTGITPNDMQAYKDLNKQLSDPFPSSKVRGPEAHSSGAAHSQTPHGHVGPIDHIPIISPKP